MIFADSKLLGAFPAQLSTAKGVDGLSESTGADIVVSDKLFPPLGDLIRKHATGNSVFISLTEFPGKRTEAALKKLVELDVRVKQFVILGNVMVVSGDQAWYGNAYKGSYRAYIEQVAHLISAGAQVINISDEYLDTYVQEIESNINKYEKFIPSDLKSYGPMDDGSLTLATVPVIRASYAKAIYDGERERGKKPNLIDVIATYTNRKKMGKDSRALAICDGTRSWFGIPDGWNIALTPEDDEKQ